MDYDYLIVGAGLFGSVFAHEAKERGKRCLVVERRAHRGGNIRCDVRDGIPIHVYGAHIFHTSNREVWTYVNRFVVFNNFINSPVANFKGELFNLPFNMNTFRQMWGVVTPAEAAAKIESQRREALARMGASGDDFVPRNLEEQAISLVGTDIYEKVVKGYTEKQWGRAASELPAFIIRRLPVRYTYDNNYFSDRWQGIPEGGYNGLIDKLLEGVEVRLGVDYLEHRAKLSELARRVVYTGAIDAYFDYEYGELAYRGLRFENERLEEANAQGVAVMNYTDRETPYTRIIEHKHFAREDAALSEEPVTWLTREYPAAWKRGEEAYYPVVDDMNRRLYTRYAERAATEKGVLFGGRLGEYKYYDMDKVIESALLRAREELG